MSNGRKISRSDANELVEKGAKIKKENDGVVKGIMIGAGFPTDVRNFYASTFNGYIFDKDLVDRFFPAARYLLVLQAASSDGTPTVLLAGCNDGDESGSFKTLAIEEPASQHPPKQFMAEFPLAAAGDERSYEIKFTLIK
jgi:hypothetical protein